MLDKLSHSKRELIVGVLLFVVISGLWFWGFNTTFFLNPDAYDYAQMGREISNGNGFRKKLERTFTDSHGAFLLELETLRGSIIKDVPDQTRRKTILGQLVNDESFDYFVQNGPTAWRQRAEEIIHEHQT